MYPGTRIQEPETRNQELIYWKFPLAGKFLIWCSLGNEYLAFFFNYGTGESGQEISKG